MSTSTRIGYAILLLISIVVAWWLTSHRQRRMRLSIRHRCIVGVAAFVGAAIGSKMPFLAEQGWEGLYRGTVWFADGKTILGGIVGGYLAVELAKFISGIRVRTGDSFALPVSVAVGVGRIGCFLAGCCHGCVTNVPWGVNFGLATDPPQTLRHPSQIYEVAFHFLAALVLMGMDRKQWFTGNQLKFYLMAYFVFRFLTEWLRPEPRIWLGLSAYQWTSIGLIAILGMHWIYQDAVAEPSLSA